MPPLPDAPQTLKVVVEGNYGVADFPWANILHFKYTGSAPSHDDCANFAGQVSAAWSARISGLQISTCVMNHVVVTDLTSPTSASGEDLTARTGTRGDDEIPANAAFLVSYPAPLRYRGGHPRTYLVVGGNADFTDSAHWSTGLVTEVATAWIAFIHDLVGASSGGMTILNFGTLSYVSKVENPTPPHRRATPLYMVLHADSANYQIEMASQRRRIGRSRR